MKLFRKKETVSAERPVPKHIAIVMDGNGRWATSRGLPRTAGHSVGSEVFRKIATYCKEIGVQYLTVYAFSTENWKRSEEEVGAIMGLLKKYLFEALEKMEQDQIRLQFFGDLSRLSPELQELAKKTREISGKYEGFQANICLNYGGRDEIVRAAREYARRCAEGKADPDALTEADFGNLLYSSGIPDPELIIRPSGEIRISNFLLWQSAYAEYYFTDVLWPDFTPEELEKAIAAFNGRNRRFGGV
ncbi:MAG: di-trans,poly-cis-decaprenylcistransferase [Oscillospiraceae bacterium]|nr:di-trans,poly-cis-decaprenylcistransferase [Oscillospiraceae bacterium]